MAEVLGVVASGIAVGTLAGKMVHLTWKLKDIRDQVKSAPNDIADLLQEIECLNLVLCQITKYQAVPNTFQDEACLKQTVELCEKAVTTLTAMLDDLSKFITTKKGWKKISGSFEIVSKRKELARLSTKVQSSMLVLSLAQQSQIRSMLHVQPDLMFAKYVSFMEQNPQIRHCYHSGDLPAESKDKPSTTQEIIPRAVYDARSSSSPLCFRNLLGSFQHKSVAVARRGKLMKEIEAKYRPPWWISQVNFHLQACSRLSGWRINYHGYLLRPEDHVFNIAIQQGDIVTVQKMLSDKTAFITDRFGWNEDTVLHTVAQTVNVEMMQLLINEGANPMIQDLYGRRPVVHLMRLGWRSTPEARIECYRLLLCNDAKEFLEEDLKFFIKDSPTELRYLQNQFYVPYPEFPMDYRLRIALTISTSSDSSILPDTIDLALASNGHITEEMAHWRDRENMTVLHHLMTPLIDLNFSGNYDSQNLPIIGRAEIMRQFIQAGADLHAITHDEKSPLYCILEDEGFLGRTTTLMQWWLIRLRQWLELLESCGIDLAQYGAAERELGTFSLLASSMYYFREVLVTYGPRPCDWMLWQREPTDSYAGDFWNLVEEKNLVFDEKLTTEGAMPGAWRDE